MNSMMELPCLALHCYDHSTALFSASKEKLIVGDGETDKHLQNKTICPTARGLLLVRDPGTLATFLWNPQDGDRVHLPSLQGLEDAALMHSHCLLSDEPSAPGCVVLLVEAGGDDSTFLWYCRPGDDIGTQICSQPDEQERYEKTPICPIAACRGKFYVNASSTELGVLEFSPDPVFSFVVVDDDGSTDEPEEDEDGEVEPRKAVFLVESGDELYRVTLLCYSTSYDREIDGRFIDKWDFSELRWHSVEDLGGRTFLLSRFYFGASCPGSDDSEHGLRQDRTASITLPTRGRRRCRSSM